MPSDARASSPDRLPARPEAVHRASCPDPLWDWPNCAARPSTGRVVAVWSPQPAGDLAQPAAWRMLGTSVGKRNKQADKGSGQQAKHHNPVCGYHFRSAIDAHSRLACSVAP